jgi:hypothetical protein
MIILLDSRLANPLGEATLCLDGYDNNRCAVAYDGR